MGNARERPEPGLCFAQPLNTEPPPRRQLFFTVVAKKMEGSCRVLRDLHFGQAGARLVCSLIRCTTENRFPHFSHL